MSKTVLDTSWLAVTPLVLPMTINQYIPSEIELKHVMLASLVGLVSLILWRRTQRTEPVEQMGLQSAEGVENGVLVVVLVTIQSWRLLLRLSKKPKRSVKSKK
jgi:hypothetical protein